MKIGTLLTSAIVSLSTVGGGLAVYVAVTKYQTMERISEAEGRLAIVRAVSDIPRYLNPERGFSTNILYGPASIDPALLTEQDKLRKQTDGARDRMNARRKELPGSFEDGSTIGNNIDGINAKFTALREAIDKALAGPAESRKDAAKKIVADNAVLNAGVTALLNEQVRRMAILNGDAYRQASYANIAMTLRDVGGFNSSLHKNLVGGKKPATDAEKADIARSQGRNDQIVMALQELRGNPSTPANVAEALEKFNAIYVEEFGRELKLVKDGAVTGKYEHDMDTYYAATQRGLGTIIGVRDAFYDNAEQILAQRIFRRPHQLHHRPWRSPCRADRQRRPDRDGPPPRLRPDRRLDDAHDTACRWRRCRRDPRRRALRRDRRDGRGGSGFQGQHDPGRPARRREAG
ncbi:hypothetical protein ACVIU7_001246 [Bradyrhizobium liaoningense]